MEGYEEDVKSSDLFQQAEKWMQDVTLTNAQQELEEPSKL